MKKLLCTVAFIVLPFMFAFSQTAITTSYVSGHWTLAGSPYNIYNDLSIYDSLIIDPGVEVVFYGSYGIKVLGSLFAEGTATSRITFHAADTTFWASDTTSAGGWGGISFWSYSGPTTDRSGFSFCDVYDLKGTMGYGGITIYKRGCSMYNCNFWHNKGRCIAHTLTSSQHFEAAYNRFHDNVSALFMVDSGIINIHDNQFYNNVVGRAAITLNSCKGSFHKNDVHNNVPHPSYVASHTTMQLGIAIWVQNVDGDLSDNLIYENTGTTSAAVGISGGLLKIDRNYICNNNNLFYEPCGLTGGGGAIQAYGHAGFTGGYTKFTITNNVIANNYTPITGGGIYSELSDIEIYNNHFINNNAPSGPAITLRMLYGTTANVRNNIFYGNQETATTVAATQSILIEGGDTASCTIAHNWLHTSALRDIDFTHYSGPAIDTTGNIVGISPSMIAPTVHADYTESALTANFNISVSSACIDNGDTCLAAHPYDYLGNIRIYGSNLDIGAFEYGAQPPPPPLATGNGDLTAIAADIAAFPNPTEGVIYFATAAPAGVIRVMDVTGNWVKEIPLSGTNTMANLSTLPRGVYLAVLTVGSKYSYCRFILQ